MSVLGSKEDTKDIEIGVELITKEFKSRGDDVAYPK